MRKFVGELFFVTLMSAVTWLGITTQGAEVIPSSTMARRRMLPPMTMYLSPCG